MPCFVSNLQYPHIGTYHNPLYWLPWTHLLQVHLSIIILAKMNNFGIFMKSFAGLSISKYYISIKVFPLKCTFFDWSLILCEASFDIKFNSSLLKKITRRKNMDSYFISATLFTLPKKTAWAQAVRIDIFIASLNPIILRIWLSIWDLFKLKWKLIDLNISWVLCVGKYLAVLSYCFIEGSQDWN